MPRMGIVPMVKPKFNDCRLSHGCLWQPCLISLLASVLVVSLLTLAPRSLGIEVQANLLSDYSFRGISQTKGSPSYHLGTSLLPLAPLPIYTGVDVYRVYQIDEQERSKHAVNYHLGLEHRLSDRIKTDLGLTWYTYHGQGGSEAFTKSQERNYPEWYMGFWYQQHTSLYLHYTDDALGSTNARNLAFELRHLIPLWLDLELYAGRVTSLDKNKLLWDDDQRYLYFGLVLGRAVGHWSASVTIEGTSLSARTVPALKDRGERKLIAQLGYHWSTHSE